MKLVAVLTGQNLNKELDIFKKYKNYIYAVEIRADFLYPELSKINKIITKLKSLSPSTKIILTFRSKAEGGKTKISENQRKNIITNLLKENHKYVNFVDIEFFSKIFPHIAKLTNNYHKKLIISCHFNKTISEKKLIQVFNKIKNKTFHTHYKPIIKIVVRRQNLNQYFNMLRKLNSFKRNIFTNLSIFTIGKTSVQSRLIGLLIKMPLVYSSLYLPVISTQPTLPQLLNFASKIGICSLEKNN
ncbi:MAG: type I 3-dehydroquinate dehydratase [Endomicrobia bacterium]|nr:type I 3-dehydroquinate dehydratase [Endomicrobiia bacterium]MDW8055393.1 type I 3-dehydroquinate dehydratase [Elusimicrobiota bacterium]